MTQFSRPSFSVVMTGNGAMCRERGHSAMDSRARCLCCGEEIGANSGNVTSRDVRGMKHVDVTQNGQPWPLTPADFQGPKKDNG